MANIREPQFMQELHTIREKLGLKWQKMSDQEVIEENERCFQDFLKRYNLKSQEIAPGVFKLQPLTR